MSPPADLLKEVFKVDATRGFLGVMFALQSKHRMRKAAAVSLIGFGGVGHHLGTAKERAAKIRHGHDAELELYAELAHCGDIRLFGGQERSNAPASGSAEISPGGKGKMSAPPVI